MSRWRFEGCAKEVKVRRKWEVSRRSFRWTEREPTPSGINEHDVLEVHADSAVEI
jgi:hypothetical protein